MYTKYQIKHQTLPHLIRHILIIQQSANPMTYQSYRENCPYLKEHGHHNIVKGHNTCCCDDNVEVKERELKEHKNKMERWIEEIIENWNVVFAHQDDCSECKKRLDKISEINDLISEDHEKNKRYLNRYLQ